MKRYLYSCAVAALLASSLAYADTTAEMSNSGDVKLNMNSQQNAGGGLNATTSLDAQVDTNGDGVINNADQQDTTPATGSGSTTDTGTASTDTSSGTTDTGNGTATETCNDNDAGTGCPPAADENGVSGTADVSRNSVGTIDNRQSGSATPPEQLQGVTGTSDSTRDSLGTSGARQSGTGGPTTTTGANATTTPSTTSNSTNASSSNAPAPATANDSSHNSLGTSGARQSGTGK